MIEYYFGQMYKLCVHANIINSFITNIHDIHLKIKQLNVLLL